MSRGRLIFAMEATLSLLDTAATETATEAVSNVDNDLFGMPTALSAGGDTRVYSTEVTLPCQVETERDAQRTLNMARSGDDEINRLVLVFHFQDLEDNALVNAQGRALIKKGDRLVRIVDQLGNEIDDYGTMDLSVISVEPSSAGLSSGRRNLLIVTLERRRSAD